MDLTTTPTPTKSPDTENETPPRTQPTKSLSCTNGAIKKLHHRKNHHHHQPPAVLTYKECLKNHAASLGGHALDGCGEFMPQPNATPTNPTSLKCAACGCHRNFHRREPDDSTTTTTLFLDYHRYPAPPPRHSSPSPSPSPSPPPPPPITYSYAPHMLLALSSAVPEDQPPINHHHHQVVTPATPTAVKVENSSGRKRFRTKFSQEQKDKMYAFSEKMGWKMHKSDEKIVEEFCNEIGVGKSVVKVWMHNNKSTLGKRDINNNCSNTISNDGRVGSLDNNDGHEININNNSQYYNESSVGGGVQLHVSTNASSSSS